MLIQLLAGLLLVAALWLIFRLAMGLRWARVERERARAEAAARGKRVIAEIPAADGLILFVEDGEAFHWGDASLRKRDIRGGRLLLNGGVMGSFSREGEPLPDPPPPEAFEGRERWDVVFYLWDGRTAAVHCGTLREGVSREIAGRIFAAARAAAAGEEGG